MVDPNRTPMQAAIDAVQARRTREWARRHRSEVNEQSYIDAANARFTELGRIVERACLTEEQTKTVLHLAEQYYEVMDAADIQRAEREEKCRNCGAYNLVEPMKDGLCSTCYRVIATQPSFK